MTPTQIRSALDLAHVDAMLSPEEKAVRETVRALGEDHLLPEVATWFESGKLPQLREVALLLGEHGLLGMHLDGYGCAGTSAFMYGLACLELEAVDSGIRSLVSVQGSLAMFAIHTWADKQTREQWLPRMAAGQAIGCFGLTEADSGSDPASMRTRARRDGADWVIDGRKMWITNGSVADIAVVWAQTDAGIRGFVVPTDTRGFRATTITRKLSLRASVTSELVLDSVRVPAQSLLAKAEGLRGALACLNEARFGILWGALGAARTALECALRYSLERQQFGKAIAAFQLTQHKLVQMQLAYTNGLLLAHHLGRLKDGAGIDGTQVSLGKLNNVRAALDICRTARTVLGANGISLEYPVIRHLANLESVLTYEGTEEIHTLVVGRAMTDLSAFA